MPRVHGIDIVPRRGRGRGRSRPSTAFGGGGGASQVDSAAVPATATGDSANFEEAQADASPGNTVEEIHGAALGISQEDEFVGKCESNDGEDRMIMKFVAESAPPTQSESQETILASNKAERSEAFELATPKARVQSATKSSRSNETSPTICSSSKSSSASSSAIRPRARESLNHLEFGSHSFSVQDISHKSPPRSSNNNLAFCSVGLAPSLQLVAETSPTASETAQITMGEDGARIQSSFERDVSTPVEEKVALFELQQPTEEENIASQTAQLIASENEAALQPVETQATSMAKMGKLPSAQQKQSDRQQSPRRTKDNDHPGENPNAHWLYHRCSRACIQMETRLTALELAIKTFQVMRSVPNDDNAEECLQQKLFAMKAGKRRDIDFIFEMSERASEIREDASMNEESLREIASVGDVVLFDLDNRPNDECHGDERRQPLDSSPTEKKASRALDQLPGASTPQISQRGQLHTVTFSTAEGDSLRKMHRSRRKKRPTHNGIAGNAGRKRDMASLQASDWTSANEKGPTTGDGDASNQSHADFPMEKDSIDMQDDKNWSFLPSAQLHSIEENEGMEQQSPRRVTRSMGLADGDNDGADSNAKDEKTERDKNRDIAVKSETDENKLGMNGEAEAAGANYDGASSTIDDSSKAEGKFSMNGKADAVENAMQDDQKQDEVVMNKSAVRENISRCSEEQPMVETAAHSNKSQDRATKMDDQVDLIKNSPRCSGETLTVEATAPSNENGNIAIETSDETDAKENTPPRRSEDSPISEKEVYTVVKTRQRGECKDTVRIMFTGITATHKHMEMIETIGAEYVGSIKEAHTATHVIASDGKTELRRTPKLLICICRVSQILSMEWLEQSAKEQRVLDTDDFLLLDDREAEKRYDFSMKKTIQNGILARRKRGGVLGGWSVYICSGVAGNRAPNMKEMQLIVDAAGGQVIRSLSNSNVFDPPKTIVLTSQPSTNSQLNERGVSRFSFLGAKVLSTTQLFHIIITQNLFDLDMGDDAGRDAGIDSTNGGVSGFVRCDSRQSLSSTVSVMSASPTVCKRGTVRGHRLEGNILHQPNNTGRNEDGSVRSASSRVSAVSHVEKAPVPPSTSSKLQRRKLNFDESKPSSSQKCTAFTTREQFLSDHLNVLSSVESLSTVDDKAASQTNGLWLDYFKEVGIGTKVKPSRTSKTSRSAKRLKRGVRCLRGRKRSISPLVSSTTPIDKMTAVSVEQSNQPKPALSAITRKMLLEDNPYVTWEAYVLFALSHRSENLGFHESSTSDAVLPASCFFPRPLAINGDRSMKQGNNDYAPGKRVSLEIGARNLAHGNHHSDETCEIFGSMQDVFSLYQEHQSPGMISESVIAMLALKAIEAVSAMHACGVVHNDIGMDSFLVVRRVAPTSGKQNRWEKAEDDDGSSWFLQLTGFGYRSVILNCHQQCQEAHHEHDYHCLANVIHQLLTGGVHISLNATPGRSVEFTSKAFIKGNLFLRGALSWCSLIDTLMCVGELAPASNENWSGNNNFPFRLQHPFDLLNLATPNGDEDNRMHQFGWSCRVLQELCEEGDLGGFLGELCSHNSRYNSPDGTLSSFVCSARDNRQSFVCYTSSEQTVEHLMEKESKLQADVLTLAQRETELLDKVAQFEQSREHYQSVLKRENKFQIRENELLQREQALALKVQQFERREEELCLRENRLEQRLRLLKQVSTSPIRPSLQKLDGNSNVAACAFMDNESGRKRKKACDLTSPISRYSQLLTGEGTPRESKRNQLKSEESDNRLSNGSPRYNERAANMYEDLDGESLASPRKAIKSPPVAHRQKKGQDLSSPMWQKPTKERDLRSPSMGHFHAESAPQLRDWHGESKESHEGVSSVKKRKRETRKSPKCSLHNLPRSPPKKLSGSPKRKSPRAMKVLIKFGDD